jgi:hypothetical protein
MMTHEIVCWLTQCSPSHHELSLVSVMAFMHHGVAHHTTKHGPKARQLSMLPCKGFRRGTLPDVGTLLAALLSPTLDCRHNNAGAGSHCLAHVHSSRILVSHACRQ